MSNNDNNTSKAFTHLKSGIRALESLTTGTIPDDQVSTTLEKVISEIAEGSYQTAEVIGPNSSPSPPNVADYVWQVYADLFDLVGRTAPERQQSVLDVLAGLREQHVVIASATTGDPVTLDGDGMIWRDLPTFGWFARSLWNFDVNDASEATPDNWTTWENWTAFLAKLTAVARPGAEPDDGAIRKGDPNFRDFALWAMRDAFEAPRGESGVNVGAVRLAATWIEFAAKALKSAVRFGVSYPGAMGHPGKMYSSEAWTGYNEDRWAIWREEFQAVAQDGRIDEDSREKARRAAQLMG